MHTVPIREGVDQKTAKANILNSLMPLLFFINVPRTKQNEKSSAIQSVSVLVDDRRTKMGKKTKSKNKNKKKREKEVSPAEITLPYPPPVPRCPAPPPLSQADTRAINSFLSEDFLDVILSRGVDGHLNSKKALHQYFAKLLSEPAYHAFTFPLLKGLYLGPPYIDGSVAVFAEDFPCPFLFWVCQWKQLRVKAFWTAESELVDMVLKAGANANQTLEGNKINPLFFAVKYGDLKTVDLLLKADCKIDHKDYFDRTCLLNALEHPQPPIIERLLEHLPATETVTLTTEDGSAMRFTMADVVVNSSWISTNISWAILGPPPPNCINEALFLVRQNGARFSPTGSSRAFETLETLFRSDMCMMGSDSGSDYPRFAALATAFKDVSRTLVGQVIPNAYRPGGGASDAPESKENMGNQEGNCILCNSEFTKKVTLYCGHSFCRRCIMGYGEIPADSAKGCPICFQQLCRDLQPQSPPQMLAQNAYGLPNPPTITKCAIDRLTDVQVLAEAKFQGIYSDSVSIEDLRSQLKKGREPLKAKPYRDGKPRVDLAAEIGLIYDMQGMVSVPKGGRVCIEVEVRGIPLLARVSNLSIYTAVGKSVVDELGLNCITQLKSKKFRDVLGGEKIRDVNFTCLEPFTLMIGGIEVTLHNAIQVDPDPRPLFGIQLGLDFLFSGVWCPIDVKADARCICPSTQRELSMCARIEGEQCVFVPETKEMLRYYSHDGAIAHVPLLRFSPFEKGAFLGINVGSSVKFDQCFWCCRAFPEGMQSCNSCWTNGKTVTYCDNRCCKAAKKIHEISHREFHLERVD